MTHGLHGYGVEDAGRDVFFRKVSGHEILDVGFGKHSAAGGHRIEVFGFQCLDTHLLVIDAHEHAHLVKKGSGASGAVAVHP